MGETKKVDLDGNGYYDISVYLKGISLGKANFVLTSINEKIEDVSDILEEEELQEGEITSEEVTGDVEGGVERDVGNNYYILGGIILVIILIVVGIIFIKKSKKPNKSKK